MEKYGFVYIWYDKKHRRFYIGSHWGKEDDGYVCSSTWMRNSYKRRKKDFKRKILKKTFVNRQNLLDEEYKWLSLIKDEELGKKYYNLTKHLNGHWSTDKDKLLTVGEKISKKLKEKYKDDAEFVKRQKEINENEERRKKLSEKMKGNTNGKGKKGKPGKPTSEETKKLLSEALKKAYAEGRKICLTKGKPSYFKGKFHSEETKKEISKANKGKIPLEETLKKRSESMKGKNKGANGLHNKKSKCRYCDYEGNLGVIARLHNEKCKYVEFLL